MSKFLIALYILVVLIISGLAKVKHSKSENRAAVVNSTKEVRNDLNTFFANNKMLGANE